MKIESVKNERIKTIKKLQQKKYREQSHQYLLEGWHSLKEALKFQPHAIVTVLILNEHIPTLNRLMHEFTIKRLEVIEINEAVAKVLSTTVHSDGVFAVIDLNQQKTTTSLIKPWLVLDHVQDPGNAGTMVRTADAAGFAGVVFSEGAIDPWNDKVIRSMQGSQFHLAIAQPDKLSEWLIAQRAAGSTLLGTLVDQQATDVRTFSLNTPNYALIMGNEAHGLSSEIAELVDTNLYLPIFGQAESLNVAIAAAVLMYQLQLKS